MGGPSVKGLLCEGTGVWKKSLLCWEAASRACGVTVFMGKVEMESCTRVDTEETYRHSPTEREWGGRPSSSLLPDKSLVDLSLKNET